MSLEKGNYFVVQSFMVSELKLKGIERDVYAIIWGFSQGHNIFTGSIAYLSEWTGYSERQLITVLKNLTERGLLLKHSTAKNGRRYCTYKAVLPNNVKQGSKIASDDDFDIAIEDEWANEKKPVQNASNGLKTENKTTDVWFKPKTYQNKNDVNAMGYRYGESSQEDLEKIGECWKTPKNTASKEQIAKMKKELLEKIDRVRAEKAKGVKTVKLNKGGK